MFFPGVCQCFIMAMSFFLATWPAVCFKWNCCVSIRNSCFLFQGTLEIGFLWFFSTPRYLELALVPINWVDLVWASEFVTKPWKFDSLFAWVRSRFLPVDDYVHIFSCYSSAKFGIFLNVIWYWQFSKNVNSNVSQLRILMFFSMSNQNSQKTWKLVSRNPTNSCSLY